MIIIKHRYTGVTILQLEIETLSSANLSSANLYGANLYGANLSGADLRSANLRSANLRSANLSGANLSGADLRSANLSGADIRSADLRSANLSGVREVMGVSYDPTLPARIVAQIEANPETWQQDTWHSACGTRHCIAGFATHLSGDLGKFLETNMGTATAATLLLWREGVELPSFAGAASEDETLGRLRAMAASIAAVS
jgi:uncharacterized protein YjbI with pentapeptide repeats